MQYAQGSDGPDIVISWLDSDGNPRDFSTGFTFEVKVGHPGSPALFTKVADVVGLADGLRIMWSTEAELNTVPVGAWTLQIRATRDSDGADFFMQRDLAILAALA